MKKTYPIIVFILVVALAFTYIIYLRQRNMNESFFPYCIDIEVFDSETKQHIENFELVGLQQSKTQKSYRVRNLEKGIKRIFGYDVGLIDIKVVAQGYETSHELYKDVEGSSKVYMIKKKK